MKVCNIAVFFENLSAKLIDGGLIVVAHLTNALGLSLSAYTLLLHVVGVGYIILKHLKFM
jgi:hypothetical protein